MIHGHASFSGVCFFITSSPSLSILACLDREEKKNALDTCFPCMEPDHNMMALNSLDQDAVKLPRMHSFRSWRSISSPLGWIHILSCTRPVCETGYTIEILPCRDEIWTIAHSNVHASMPFTRSGFFESKERIFIYILNTAVDCISDCIRTGVCGAPS